MLNAYHDRMTTPSKSRFNLLHGMFQKRGSTATLSTQITKLSLTKQLTRQRTDSSLALGELSVSSYFIFVWFTYDQALFNSFE